MQSKERVMATLTIRNLDDKIKKLLRIRAASHDHSMEEEVRIILKEALDNSEDDSSELGSLIHKRFLAVGGAELAIPPRNQFTRKSENIE